MPIETKCRSLQRLIELGKGRGYLLSDEISELLPDEVVSLPDGLAKVYVRLRELGIAVIDCDDVINQRVIQDFRLEFVRQI